MQLDRTARHPRHSECRHPAGPAAAYVSADHPEASAATISAAIVTASAMKAMLGPSPATARPCA
jgi:hypothetical protein